MNIIFGEFFIFLLGLNVGSFLNCIIYRLEVNQSFLKGRSYCPDCKHKLNWHDLIPVFSFLILKGKCRYCQKPISQQYPLVELATGLLFLLIFIFQFYPKESLWLPTGQAIFNFQHLLFTGYWLLITCFLIIIFIYDLKHYIIPDRVIFPAIFIALIFNFQFLIFNQFSVFENLILSAIGAAGFFLFVVLVSRGNWMGIGDIKLAFLMGFFLGFPRILFALFSAFLFGAIMGIGLIILKRKSLKSEIPFGPFLITGTILALFWGEKIMNWYLNCLSF